MTMPQWPLGTSGMAVSAVGWSTGALARPSNLTTPAALVRAALDAQITLFDSRPEGEAQEALARTLRNQRRHVVLGARCVAGAGASAFSPPGREWRPEEVRLRLEAGMRRLETDWVDLWVLHQPPLEALEDDDLWAQLDADRQSGWVRALGVATAGEEEARAALGRGAIDVLAVPLSLADVEPGRALAETGAARDVAVVADDPLGADGEAWAGRLLAGLVHPDAERSPAQAMLAGVLSLPGLVSTASSWSPLVAR
ncbi:MAG: aldo/keto reductase [Acidimicrobiia bacterium]